MSRRKICFYAIATHLGGGERSMLELVRGLAGDPERGYEPWVILPVGKGPLVDELAKLGVCISVLPLPAAVLRLSREALRRSVPGAALSVPLLGLYLLRLRALLKRERPALIHTNAIKCHALSALVGPSLGIPVLWHLRDILPAGFTLRGLQRLRKLGRIQRIHVIANSQATAKNFTQALGRDEAIDVVYNGIDLTQYQAAPHRELHHALGVEVRRPMIGILGVLARWKNQLGFLDMAAELVARRSDACFAVIGGSIYDTAGDAGYADELQAKVRALGLEKRVLFTGFRADVAHVLNGLDVLVHASKRPEPFGRVIVEAMACGVPVVASGAGGVLEIIRDRENGLLFEPDHTEQMREKVELLLGDAELRQRLVRNGLQDVRARFSREAYLASVVAIYDRLIEPG